VNALNQGGDKVMVLQAVPELKNRIGGEVILPDSPEYENVRNSFTFPGSPAVVVRPESNEDVAAAIHFARDNGLKLAVRSGGHSTSGVSTNVGGMVIDLSHFDSVEVLDTANGLVRIGAGARWGDAAEALSEHGLAISSGDTVSVGVGGLTLGGGIGWLVRKHGLTIDHLQAAEIVTADGRTLHISADENPDLFWAIRGGGGNFGVVTSFTFRSHPLKSIVGGMVIYDPAEAESIMTKWVEAMRRAPEEVNSTLVLFPGFGPEVPAGLILFLCYGGDDETAANQALKPLMELGTVRMNNVQTKPYYKMLEEAAAPPGLRIAGENGFIKTVSKDVVAALAANYGRPGTPIIQMRYLGGAVARVQADATAFAHREYEAFVLAGSFVPIDMPAEQANQAGQKAWEPLKPFASGAYINFLTNVEESNLAAAYPAATLSRLAKVKAAYDPDNVFNQNLNIKPRA
jgi:FAD/FMN-containing dehydrogenase